MQRLLRRKIQNLIESGKGWPLAPLSFLWGCAVHLRHFFYDFVKPHRVNKVVVSVGNIEVGGTGKTPLVLLLAEQFKHRKVAILSRGYGEIPDEALLLSQRVPGVQVLIGKDRVALAQKADADLIILDDGLQYRKLYRDFDLVLVTNKKEHYLPWGRLRDTPRRLKKAQIVAHQLVVKRILDGHGNELRSIRGQKISYFCGIARPQRFKKTLMDLGADIVGECILSDHEPIDLSEIERLNKKSELIITTEKDFVKLPKNPFSIYYLEMKAEITSDLKEWETLIEKIDQKIDNQPTYE